MRDTIGTTTPATVGVALCLLLLPAGVMAQERYPGAEWDTVPSPESVGWSSAGLDRARAYYDSIGSAAVSAVVDGRLLVDWGWTTLRLRMHSNRKSLVSALMGIHVAEGTIDPDASLADLGIDDGGRLTPSEQRATVRQLLKGRSGIYVPALYLGGSLDTPPRGRYEPGSHHHYNNFDFNTLANVIEREAGVDVFEDFHRRIAAPIGMQDFRARDGIHYYGSHGDNVDTRLFAYPFRMSARDAARFGLLYLRGGRWGERQVVPAEWIRKAWTPYSTYGSTTTSYGYANWKIHHEGKTLPGGYTLPGDVYWSSGIGRHRIYVAPWADLVLVHRVNSDLPGAMPGGSEVDGLLGRILEARIEDVDGTLLEAAERGEPERIRALLAAGARIGAVDDRERTALHRAAARGHAEAVRALLEAGASPNARDLVDLTPLGWATGRGHAGVAQLLLAAGADPEARNSESGGTPLVEVAVHPEYLDVARALLDGGADPDGAGAWYDETPLVMAAMNGDADMVRLLLEAGADPNHRAVNGRTARLMARSLGHDAVVDRLDGAGARPGALELLPLDVYLPPGLISDARDGELSSALVAAKILARSRAVADEGGERLLAAAIRGDASAVEAALRSRVPVDRAHEDGWTALNLAARGGHDEVVRMLLEAGADPARVDDRMEQTPLIPAAEAGHLRAVELLLDAGADVNASDRYAGTPLTRAAAAGRTRVVELLVERGARIEARQESGGTALVLASDGGHAATVRALVEAGAEVDVRDGDDRTPLMHAAAGDDPEIARILLDAGADPDARDRFGWTPLWIADELGHEDVAEILRNAGGTR